MTKARTKAGNRRAKQRRSITLPGGEIAANPLRGTDRRGTQARETPEDAQKTALEARKRVFGGIGCQTAEEAFLEPLRGSQVGYCITTLAGKDDRAEIWQVWQDICAARRNYHQRILSRNADPQCAAIAMVPDAMQSDESLRVDLRTGDERDAAAKRVWDEWCKRIKALGVPQMIWAVRAALDDGINPEAAPFWLDGQPTDRGRALVLGLRKLVGY